ncbi:D-ribose ABC transporter substrate-binding protein [Peptostreptococcus equinus]|uniref:D-ribose ABC transporter substrate-binding protein n=1 Tax=Peptostreptococcus equinus TaxID=3003601 RepID=A0ABY7JP61_9FIRM|nr:D-ribose ABC transporter substrate-binding protein [Peptostreptococcus sp. CBA3647]WAW14959.1 D-ribose ABC transporter substrate-binding protein [Peptostreptococcus sp. CBA3647]
MKKRISLFLAAALVSMTALTGCESNRFVYLEGEKPGDNTTSVEKKDPKDLKIGLSLSTLNNPFFVSVKDGAEKLAKEKGSKIIISDARDDAATQANNMSDLIQQDVDVILVNPVDSKAIATSVQAANEAGIPVIALDRNSEGGKLLTLVASDNVKGGEMAAQFMIDKVGKGSNVAQLEGIAGASATNERGKGFLNLAKKDLKLVKSQTADFDRAKGLTVMENILQSNPDIKGVFCQNDEMALGAIEAISNAGKLKDITIVGFDGTEGGMKAVQEGKLNATVAQQPDQIGKLGVQAAFDYFAGKKIPEKIASPLVLEQKK